MNHKPPQAEQERSPDDEQFDVIFGLAREISALHSKGAAECTILVDNLIASRCNDVAQIQHLLDLTLDACAHKSALPAYKRLCRYLAQIDPEGASFYVNSYHEMWGDEELEAE